MNRIGLSLIALLIACGTDLEYESETTTGAVEYVTDETSDTFSTIFTTEETSSSVTTATGTTTGTTVTTTLPLDEVSADTSADCLSSVGSEACAWTLINENGDLVSLSDYAGTSVLLDFSTGWCGPCMDAASHSQETMDLYADENFQYIIVMIEDEYADDPTEATLQDLRSDYGITSVVTLAGTRELLLYSSGGSWDVQAWPTFYYINDGIENGSKMTPEPLVEWYHSGWSESLVDSNIQVLLGL